MINAKINFLNNSLVVNLSRPLHEIQDNLRSIGILTAPDLIMIDNTRTLQIELFSEDSIGNKILALVNRKNDTLGRINRLCHSVYCMDYRDEMNFVENLDNGKYNTLERALRSVEKMREKRKIMNKKKEEDRLMR